MPQFPTPNKNTPPIPVPAENLSNLVACVAALKAGVESLIGQRGAPDNRAVTFKDLVSYGVMAPITVRTSEGAGAGGGGGSASGGGGGGDVDLSGYLPVSGGTLSGPLYIIPGGETGFNTDSSALNSQMLRFKLTPGDESNAGKIAYRAHGDQLDILGAGVSGGARKIKLWDSVTIPLDLTVSGVSTFNGAARVVTTTNPAFGVSGLTYGIRFLQDGSGSHIQGVDNTLNVSYQPLNLNGSIVTAPTPATANNSTQIATTAFVKAQGYLTSASGYLPIAGGVMTGQLSTSGSYGVISQDTLTTGLMVYGRAAGDAAYLIFHRPGAFAVAFGLDVDNQLAYGGWSMGAARRVLWDTNNLNPGAYLPLSGGTLSGALTVNAGGIRLNNSSTGNVIRIANAGGQTLTMYNDTNAHIAADGSDGQLYINWVSGRSANFGGVIATNVNVQCHGASAGFFTDDRTGTYPPNWAFWASGGILRIWNGGAGDRLFVNNNGDFYPAVYHSMVCGANNPWWEVKAANFTNTSDPRLKQDIEPAPPALDNLRALVPITYRWRAGKDTKSRFHGFSSADVRAVMGDDWGGVVTDNGVDGIAFNQMLAVLWQATRELAAEVIELKRRYDA